MALEILVNRDPDGDITLHYFKDGHPVYPEDLGITEIDFDPGRHDDYDAAEVAEWRESMEAVADSVSPAAGAAIRELMSYYE